MSAHLSSDLSPPPPLVLVFEHPASRGRVPVIPLLLALLWLGLGVGDWFMRFQWFGWHRNFVVRAAAPPAADQPARAVTNGPSQGGDLSRLIGIRAAAARYEQGRPAATNFVDASGFRNTPPVLDRYPVVVVGDSYAAAGPRGDDVLAARLASDLAVPVYNHAVDGRGTFWALVRFFASAHFRGREPRVLVWPVIEREIAGVYFLGGLSQVLTAQPPSNAPAARAARIDWAQLAPRALKRSLPNTSAYSLAAGKVWNRLRHSLLGRLNPAVVPSASDAAGGPMLFYAEALAAQRWSDEVRDLPRLQEAFARLAGLARARGIEPLIVLVPDKERVYAASLPAGVRASVRPSVLPEVEARLRSAGIRVVNLLPAFESAAGRGELLFWRDDTHWNPDGIRLAARTIAPEVRRLLGGGPP